MPLLRGRTEKEREIVVMARKNRPVCMECGKQMEPIYRHEDLRVEDEHGFRCVLVIVGVRGYGYAAQGVFCSLRCGYLHGMRAASRLRR